jgi:hypothetical protein
VSPIHWLIEDLTDGSDPRMASAARSAGHRVSLWDDAWWDTRRFPVRREEAVVFHGSLGNAHRVVEELRWSPGAFCDAESLAYSAWADRLADVLVNRRWLRTTARALADAPRAVADTLGATDRLFVRPDSPLKPFAGRVLAVESVSLAALDHGFYYDNADLPVVVAPAVEVGREWRVVVVDGRVVATGRYEAARRTAAGSDSPSEVTALAEEVAGRRPVKDAVYAVDVAEMADGLKVVELNPFSGADLYDCDRAAIVEAVGGFLGDGAPLSPSHR